MTNQDKQDLIEVPLEDRLNSSFGQHKQDIVELIEVALVDRSHSGFGKVSITNLQWLLDMILWWKIENEWAAIHGVTLQPSEADPKFIAPEADGKQYYLDEISRLLRCEKAPASMLRVPLKDLVWFHERLSNPTKEKGQFWADEYREHLAKAEEELKAYGKSKEQEVEGLKAAVVELKTDRRKRSQYSAKLRLERERLEQGNRTLRGRLDAGEEEYRELCEKLSDAQKNIADWEERAKTETTDHTSQEKLQACAFGQVVELLPPMEGVVENGQPGEVENDSVNHPSHYTYYRGIEVIELTSQMDFCRGNAVKYLARAGRKDGADELEDLKKAQFYVDYAITDLELRRDE